MKMAEQLHSFQRHKVKIFTKLQWLGSRYDENREINQKILKCVIYRVHIHIKLQFFKKYAWNHDILKSSSSAIMQENGVTANIGLLALLFSCSLVSDTVQKTCSFALWSFRMSMWWGEMWGRRPRQRMTISVTL